MNSISVICTIHDEVGPANVSELLAILIELQPRVIFLEVPRAALDDYYVRASRSNLESRAVTRYIANHQAELVPVDMPTPEREFFEDLAYLQQRMRDASLEYRQLMRQDKANLIAHGFHYLNSKYSSELWRDIYDEMQHTIERIGDARLSDIFVAWKEKNSLRETTMIDNIQAFCRTTSFGHGAFLVGAAHRQALIDKTRGQTLAESTQVQWDFLNYGD